MRLGFEDERAWNDAARRLQIIEPLIDRSRTTADVRERATLAGCHLTTVYAWLRRYEADRTLAALLPGRSDGGRGKSRLSPKEEGILVSAIDAYVQAGRPSSVRALCETIRQQCEAQNVPAPHPNTIRARVAARAGSQRGESARPRAARAAVRPQAVDRFNRMFAARASRV